MNTEKIMEDIQSVQDNIREIKSTWGNTIMTLDNIKSGLKADVQKKVDEAYQRGHDDGYEAGCATAFKPVSDAEYQRGLEDAWEATKKIFGYEIDGAIPIADIGNVFGYEPCKAFCTADILRDFTVQEAIAKLKAYEDKHSDRIEVGDEVEWDDDFTGDRFIVTRIYQPYGKKEQCDGIDDDGDVYRAVLIESLVKTGKHYDIASILEAMRK